MTWNRQAKPSNPTSYNRLQRWAKPMSEKLDTKTRLKIAIKYYTWTFDDVCAYFNLQRKDLFLFLLHSDKINNYAIHSQQRQELRPKEAHTWLTELYNGTRLKVPQTFISFNTTFIQENKNSIVETIRKIKYEKEQNERTLDKSSS